VLPGHLGRRGFISPKSTPPLLEWSRLPGGLREARGTIEARMPNTLVHFAVQGAASRGLWRRPDPRWIYLGCLLPDVPWILRRAIAVAGLGVDAVDLRLYTMAQASLAGTLLLCAALAALSAAPRRAFAVLGLNALAHLLLDACEIKWGNGVHLFAPFSWRMTGFDLVRGEHAAVLALTLAGALLVAWDLARPGAHVIALDLRARRLALAAAWACAYFVAPLAFFAPLEASDSYSVKTVRELAERPGRTAQFDRATFRAAPDGGRLEIWSGERLRVSGLRLDHDARVSLRGTFLAPDLLRVDGFVEHRRNRDWPSYLALGLLALVWLRPHVRARRRSPDPPATSSR
jgi:hypothetical protein